MYVYRIILLCIPLRPVQTSLHSSNWLEKSGSPSFSQPPKLSTTHWVTPSPCIPSAVPSALPSLRNPSPHNWFWLPTPVFPAKPCRESAARLGHIQQNPSPSMTAPPSAEKTAQVQSQTLPGKIEYLRKHQELRTRHWKSRQIFRTWRCRRRLHSEEPWNHHPKIETNNVPLRTRRVKHFQLKHSPRQARSEWHETKKTRNGQCRLQKHPDCARNQRPIDCPQLLRGLAWPCGKLICIMPKHIIIQHIIMIILR